MSGGAFDYVDRQLSWKVSDEIRKIIKNNDVTNEWGEKTGYRKDTLEAMDEVAKATERLACLISSLDYFLSYDTSEDDFMSDYQKWKSRL